MRIALLTMHSCPLAQAGSRDSGGMNVYVLALAKELEARDFCIDIFTRYHTARDPEVIRVGARTRVVHVPTLGLDETKDDLHLSVPSYVEGVDAFRQAEGLSYGLVHSHYWLSGQAGLTLAPRWNVPHLTSFHTLAKIKDEAFPDNAEPPQRAPAEARVAAGVDWTIAWTAHEAAALTRLYEASPDRVAVIPIGVDMDLFQPHDRDCARRKLGIAPNEELLLYVGRLDPIKGPRLFVEIVALLKDRPRMRAMMVGDNQRHGEREGLLRLAGALGVAGRIRFLDPAPHEDLPRYYSAADVQVVPSYYESFSMVTAEALACGTPVVASDVGGPASLVKDGVAGVLVAPGDAPAFARTVRDLLDDPQRRRRMASQARGTVAHLGWSTVADRITSLYAASLRNAAGLTACAD